MLLRFIGTDYSTGLKHGEMYRVKVFDLCGELWVDWGANKHLPPEWAERLVIAELDRIAERKKVEGMTMKDIHVKDIHGREHELQKAIDLDAREACKMRRLIKKMKARTDYIDMRFIGPDWSKGPRHGKTYAVQVYSLRNVRTFHVYGEIWVDWGESRSSYTSLQDLAADWEIV